MEYAADDKSIGSRMVELANERALAETMKDPKLATNEWLDMIARNWGLTRKPSELDYSLRVRIFEAINAGTPPA